MPITFTLLSYSWNQPAPTWVDFSVNVVKEMNGRRGGKSGREPDGATTITCILPLEPGRVVLPALRDARAGLPARAVAAWSWTRMAAEASSVRSAVRAASATASASPCQAARLEAHLLDAVVLAERILERSRAASGRKPRNPSPCRAGRRKHCGCQSASYTQSS